MEAGDWAAWDEDAAGLIDSTRPPATVMSTGPHKPVDGTMTLAYLHWPLAWSSFELTSASCLPWLLTFELTSSAVVFEIPSHL